MAEHGTRDCYQSGCRRVECREANAAYHRAARARRRGQPMPADVVHGKSTYVNWLCRCEVCTKANTDAKVRTDDYWRSLMLG